MSRPMFDGEHWLLALCHEGAELGARHAAQARDQGDEKLAAWWTGRELDLRRYAADVVRELDTLHAAREAASSDPDPDPNE